MTIACQPPSKVATKVRSQKLNLDFCSALQEHFICNLSAMATGGGDALAWPAGFMPAAPAKGIDDQRSLKSPNLSNIKRSGVLQTIPESECSRLRTPYV
jgi:hypothetical protein